MSNWPDEQADRERADKVADDPPPYPPEWGERQRSAAYWFVVKNRGRFPRFQSGWYAILAQAERASEHHREIVAEVVAEQDEDDYVDPTATRMPYKD